MIIEDEDQILKRDILKTIKVAWFILGTSLILFFVLIYFTMSHKSLFSTQEQLWEQVQLLQTEIVVLEDEVEVILDTYEDLSLLRKTDVSERLETVQKIIQSINSKAVADELSETELLFYKNAIKSITKEHLTFSGIIDLVLKQNEGVYENRLVIKSQLYSTKRNYLLAVHELEVWSVKQMSDSSSVVFKLNIFTFAWYFMLVVLGYFKVISSLQKNVIGIDTVREKWTKKIKDNDKDLAVAVKQDKASQLILKTKNVQVLKLQESLDESIRQMAKMKKDKKTAFFNIASDIDSYLNVLNLQKEILENQTDISENLNWISLTNGIVQMRTIVDEYFNKAKRGDGLYNQQEVYLTQLVSEIIISIPNKGKIVFEQIADMPNIRTDVDALKRVLEPFFEFISSCNEGSKVSVSIIELGMYCEIKFIGLTQLFREKWEQLDDKDSAELGLNTFRIHMAKNTVEERGGKIWLQFDVGEKGIFHISWVL
jgi:hypothetical protein